MRHQAKATLSALIESTEDLIWSVDLDYRLIAFNSAFQNHIEGTFGVRPGAGMCSVDFVPKERMNLMPPLYDRARAEGSFRVEFLLAGGRTLELFFNPIVSDGETKGISVFGKDITERKAAEEARALLVSIVESSDDAIHAVNLDGTVVSWNHGAEVLFGYTAAEIIGKSIAILAPPGRGDEVPRFLGSVAGGGSVAPFDTALRGKDGRMIEVSLSLSPYKNTAGEIVGASAIARDISQRLRFERDIQQAEEKYRSIFDGALEGIFQASFDSKPLAANPALARILGYESPRELLHSINDVSHDIWFDPEERGRFLQLLKEKDDGAVLGYECRFKRKNGSIVWVSLNSRLVCADDGSPLYYEGFLIDITNCKQAQESLRESGDFLAEAQKFGNLGCYALDIPLDAWTSSHALDEIFGIDGKYDRTVEGWTALIHPRDRAMMADYFQNEVVGQHKDFDKEYRIVRASDQAERWVHGTGRLEFSAQGQPLKMHGIIKDITERKLSEIKLRDSVEHYRAIFHTAPDPVMVSRLDDGVIIDANRAFLESSGYQHSEIVGHSIMQLGIWVNAADRQLMVEQLLHNKYCRNLEVQSRKKNGETYWMRLSASLIEIAGRQCILTFARDITESRASRQRLAEAASALRRSEKRYRKVFQTSVDGIALSQLSDGKYIDANAAFLQIMGYEREEIIGRTSLELNFWVDREDRQRMLAELREHSSLRGMQIQHVKKNGEITWLLVSATTIEMDGRLCMISSVQDISEAKASEQRLAEAANALRASEERYRSVFRMNIDAVDICHLEDSRFIDVNDAFVACTGFQRDEVIGRTALELGIWANPADRDQMVEIIRRDGACRSLQAPYHTKDGTLRWALLSVAAIELDGVPCILSVTRDITEAKAAEQRLAAANEALRVSEERYRATFQLSIDAININRLSDGVFVDVNEAFLQFVGFERDEVIGRTSRELNFWVDPDVRQQMVDTLRRGASCRDLKARFRRKNGEIVWGQASESILEIDGVPCILSVTRDISAARAAEEQIRDLAFYDPLTHLPNRRLLMERLRQSLAASARTNRKRAILFVDLDDFKTLNDTLGHKTGDLLLQEVAVRLAACIRESDTVARLGGDEFIVMLEDLSDIPEDAAAQAEAIGEKMLAAVDQPFWLSGRECLSTCSIGITVFGDKRESTDEVLQQADIAMYQAKAAGRNTMRFFAPALQAAVNARAALEEDIRQGIKASQFELYYQPQLDSIGLVGAEALVRWNHPRRGLLLPGEFIPLSEETGLVIPLGDWVLENACAQVAAWAGRMDTSRISLAVNISARQFRQPSFVEKVLAALERTGANPQRIKLELTESMLVDNIEDVIAKMTELKSHGLKFSLDDFGTGYSSLAYLKRLPLDQLKIDSSFVRDILSDVGSRAIAQSVISLGRALGLSVIAECVETEEQRVLLSRIGCHAFQGFLFSRPIPLDVFEKQWLSSSEITVPIAG